MSTFLDSSALVKLYADEEGSIFVRDLPAMVISLIARVEVPAALWRKARISELSESDARLLVTEFEADLFGVADEPSRFVAIAVSPVILNQAAALLPLHGLRAYDAIQLASAMLAAEADPGCRSFACFDYGLSRAASAQGLHVMPGKSGA